MGWTAKQGMEYGETLVECDGVQAHEENAHHESDHRPAQYILALSVTYSGGG